MGISIILSLCWCLYVHRRDKKEEMDIELTSIRDPPPTSEPEMFYNVMNPVPSGKMSVATMSNGNETTNPLFEEPALSTTVSDLSINEDGLLSGLGIDGKFEDDETIAQLKLELDADITMINDFCSLEENSQDPCEIAERANIKLNILETLATQRAGTELWGLAKAVVQPVGCSDAWTDLLDRIKMVRSNLNKVEQTSRERSHTNDKNAWVQSLRANLRHVSKSE